MNVFSCRGMTRPRMFAELAELGAVALVAHTQDVPPFTELNPEVCYVTWTITLTTELTLEAIHSVFEWAEGDCELNIAAILPETPDTAPQDVAAPPREAAQGAGSTPGAVPQTEKPPRRPRPIRTPFGSPLRRSMS